jgi:hypothetical protein
MHESKKTNLGLWGKDSRQWVFFFNLDLFEFAPMGTVADLGTGYALG